MEKFNDNDLRRNKIDRIRERVFKEIEEEKDYYISTLKDVPDVDDYNKIIFLLEILKEFFSKEELFTNYSYLDYGANKIIYKVRDNTLDLFIYSELSITRKWLDVVLEGDNILILKNFLNDNYFDRHFFSIFERTLRPTSK